MKWTPNRYRSDLWLRVRQVDGGSPMTCWKCHSGNCQRPWSQQLFWVLKASGSAWPGCAVELAGNLRSRDLRTLTGVMIFFSCCQYAVPKSPKKSQSSLSRSPSQVRSISRARWSHWGTEAMGMGPLLMGFRQQKDAIWTVKNIVWIIKNGKVTIKNGGMNHQNGMGHDLCIKHGRYPSLEAWC